MTRPTLTAKAIPGDGAGAWDVGRDGEWAARVVMKETGLEVVGGALTKEELAAVVKAIAFQAMADLRENRKRKEPIVETRFDELLAKLGGRQEEKKIV